MVYSNYFKSNRFVSLILNINIMKQKLYLLLFVLLVSVTSKAQSFTENFNTNSGANVNSFTRTLSGVPFTFTCVTNGDNENTTWSNSLGVGNGSSVRLYSYSNNTSTETFVIKRQDNKDFVFTSLYCNNLTFSSQEVLGGYNNNVLVGSTQTISSPSSGVYNFGGIVVDEVRISSTDLSIYIDDFSGSIVEPATHLNFDGANDSVSLPGSVSTAISQGSEITIEYWFKGNNLQSAVRFQNGSNYIVAGWGSSNPQFIVSTDDGTNGVSNGTESVIEDNTWHHIACVWKKNVRFATYLDGVLQNSRVAANVNLPDLSGVVGQLGSFLGTSEFMTGNLDDVRIWNVARTAAQISANKNCELQGNESGLVAYYKFNQGLDAADNTAITSLTDATANAYNGTLVNFARTGTTSNFLSGSPVTTGITVPTAPTVSAQTFCGATTANSLVPAISATIKWYASATALVTTDNLTTGTYYVVAVNANGCESERVASTVTITNPQFGAANPEILYYKFNGTGTSVPNLASAPPVGAENATILGAITQGGSGNTGGALNGSGVSSTTDYLNTNWNTNLVNSSWSIAFWSSGFSSPATVYYIFGDANANLFRCFTNGFAGANNWVLRGNGIADVFLNGGATASPNLCVFVYDNIANNIKAYLNGVLVNTVNQTPGAVNIVSNTPFKVMGYSSNIGAPVGGKLDDFGLFSRVLTLTEIQNLYQQNVYTTQAYCNGATVANLLPNTSSTVKWYASATGGTELATSEVLTTGLYYATPVIGTCEGARTTVNVTVTTLSNATTQNANVVTATENASGVTYQWYQCGTPNVLLTGETNQSYTSTANGDYYVQITKGTCVVSSVCETLLGNSNFEINSGLSIYPNPSKGIFNISIQEDANVTVNDILGKVIYTNKVKAGNNTIDISNYQSGMYLLNITNENGSATKKLMKE
jgi:hypothetical protein